jgi:hypothetical protein
VKNPVRLSFLVAALVLAATAHAQQRLPRDPAQPPEVPPPPALRLSGLIPLDVPGATDARWGVDPQSVQVTPDGTVRYVAVAQSSSGAVSAFYESLRCDGAEVKVHARRGRDGDWVSAGERETWRPVDGGSARHTRAIWRAGACAGPAPNGNAAQVVHDLRRSASGYGDSR